MEPLYLLCSIISSAFTSSLLSLSLFLRSIFSPSYVQASQEGPIRLYEGRVRHVRRRPVSHSFEYLVRYALFDLDRAPLKSDHLTAARAREIAGTNGPVFLLTIPKSVGYEQNPLSIYYCYDMKQESSGVAPPTCLKICIAEVTNTPWGERVRFLFHPGSDIVAKPLHVSPFMDMMGNWSIHTDEPKEELSVVISVQHSTLGNYFTATLRAKQIHYSPIDSLTLENYFYLMPHKVALWIYWQALKLWWKGVKFLDHPRYQNSQYREEAIKRDRELSGPCKFSISNRNGEDGGKCKINQRWFAWTDAKWPWS